MDAATVRWVDIAAAHLALRLLVLLGSRATGTARPDPDWDVGFLADEDLDLGTLAADLTHALGTDAVDVVDLARASAVLRRDAVAGVLLHERSAGEFVQFQVEAALFWCDVEPVLREAHADVLRAFASGGAGAVAPADPAVLAERLAALDRHLRRFADQLTVRAEDLQPVTEASDAVVLHLWQAVQITIDLAVSWCVRVGLGAPPTYGDAFRRLAAERLLDEHLAADLVRAVGFRNLLVHAYADLELARVHQAATMAPTDLRAFAGALLAAQGLDRVLRAPAVPGERPAGHAAPARDVRP